MRLRVLTLSVTAMLWAAAALPQNTRSVYIPQRGNTFVTGARGGNTDAAAAKTISTRNGNITRWYDKKTVISLYFKAGGSGMMDLTIHATAGKDEQEQSTLQIACGRKKYTVQLHGGPVSEYHVGSFEISRPGYVKIDIRGLKRTGRRFGDIEGFTIDGPAVQGQNHFVPQERLSDNYWYRRGPSVHMNYALPKEDVEYFYSEVCVPRGCDVNGTYFMLTGFRQGYMGIQSAEDGNGKKIRTVLFSVWSPHSTDNPNEIPDSMDVKTLAYGPGVTAQNFGNEGSGKQSFMRYPWKTGKIYKTLVSVQPDGKGNTVYTGYFCNEKGQWMLLARFLRPATDTYYEGAHSFLECFKPESSFRTRKVKFLNQWARDRHGVWHEITEGVFTCDNTGRLGVRTDMFGGVENGAFVLQNCGFIDQTTEYRSRFTRPAGGHLPDIDFEALEALVK